LAPHEDQDGWLYIRVKRHPKGWKPTAPDGAIGLAFHSPQRLKFGLPPLGYVDSHDESRIIASERVERAVENELKWLIAGFYFLGVAFGLMVGAIVGPGEAVTFVLCGAVGMFFVSMGLSMYKVVKR